MREYSIEEIIGLVLGLLDGTNDNDEETIEKLKVIEREKMKQLRRK